MDAVKEKVIIFTSANTAECSPFVMSVKTILKHELIEKKLCKEKITKNTDTSFAELSQIKPAIIFVEIITSSYTDIESIRPFITKVAELTTTIIATDNKNEKQLRALLECGVDEIYLLPINETLLEFRLKKFLSEYKANSRSDKFIKEKLGIKNIIGQSPNFLSELEKVPLIARTDSTALIKGETGTGKEVFARAIHYLSTRSSEPFIAVNCATIPEELADNELFGHEKGAYTNAFDKQVGLIKMADGGTLFLDDIDCLPSAVQAKLLRFLQEKEYRSLGSSKIMRSNARIIVATNAELNEEIELGKFRQDLFYRLNVVRVNIPPLRERGKDILEFAHYFRAEYSNQYNKNITGFSKEAQQQLLSYQWPGNIRELKNLIEAAVIFSKNKVLSATDLGFGNDSKQEIASFKVAKTRIVNEFEVNYITNLLTVFNGNISEAARAAKKDRRAFWQLIKKHNIDVSSYRLMTMN